MNDVFKLQAVHPTTRYIRLALVFLVSGNVHLGIDISGGIPCQETGVIRFFLHASIWYLVGRIRSRYVSVKTPASAALRVVYVLGKDHWWRLDLRFYGLDNARIYVPYDAQNSERHVRFDIAIQYSHEPIIIL